MESPFQDTPKKTLDEGEYWSCDWLEGCLTFLPTTPHVHACCMRNRSGAGMPILLENFKGGKLPMRRILDARSNIIRENQLTERHTLCRGCPSLVKSRWSPKPYPIDMVTFGHFSRCNCKCVYCDVAGPESKHLDFERNLLYTAKEMIEEGYLAPDAHICWIGGEPTLLPEFEDMFVLLSNRRETHSVASNGVVLSRTLLKCLPEKNLELIVSVDAGKRETYRAIKQIDAFDRVWSNLADYARVGGDKVCAKFIFLRQNVVETVEFVEKVEAAKIQSVMADVDYFTTGVDERTIRAAALMAYECRRKGIKFAAGPCQQFGRQDTDFQSRVEKAYRERVRKLNIGARLLWIIGEMDGSLRPINSGLLLDLLKRSWRSWLEVGFIGTLKNTIRFARNCHTRLLSQ